MENLGFANIPNFFLNQFMYTFDIYLTKYYMNFKSFFGVACMVGLTSVSSAVFSQNTTTINQRVERPTYRTAIGLKFAPFAVSFKSFVGQRNKAIELLGDFNNGFRLTGLYQLHGDLNGPRSLKWYVGIGAHGGYYDKNEVDGIMAGFDGVVGLDYKFHRLPLNLALDWQPSLELITPNSRFEGGRGGLAVRLAL
jgi:hypothetical protein